MSTLIDNPVNQLEQTIRELRQQIVRLDDSDPQAADLTKAIQKTKAKLLIARRRQEKAKHQDEISFAE